MNKLMDASEGPLEVHRHNVVKYTDSVTERKEHFCTTCGWEPYTPAQIDAAAASLAGISMDRWNETVELAEDPATVKYYQDQARNALLAALEAS